LTWPCCRDEDGREQKLGLGKRDAASFFVAFYRTRKMLVDSTHKLGKTLGDLVWPNADAPAESFTL
jgi:hypothetical protein